MKLANLIVALALLPAQWVLRAAPPISRTTIPQTATVIVVTNATDAVNGDTGSIAALLANPGPDGISFREALWAANKSSEEKVITFSPSLKGATIVLGSAGITWESIVLTSGNLTINGDIDADGAPDITLDGSLGATYPPLGAGLAMWSINNTIQGLKLIEFGTSLFIAVPEPTPVLKSIAGNQFIGNVIISSFPNSVGIGVGPMGLLFTEDAHLASDLTIQGTLIDGNTISVLNTGINFVGGSGGSSRNKILNTVITDNHISNAPQGITIAAGDTSSADYGLLNPIHYSDDNLIDQMTITGNIVNNTEIGIGVFGSNFSNRGNQVQHLLIANNTLHTLWAGVRMLSSQDSKSYRSTSMNVISDVQIDHNTIDSYHFGMLVGAGDFCPQPPDHSQVAGIENNQLNRVQVTNNTIQNYHEIGIRAWGGCAAPGSLFSKNNLVDQLVITGNSLLNPAQGEVTTGIEVLGGETYQGPAQENIILGLVLSTNTVSGNAVGLSVVAGRGVGAQGNHISIQEMQGNILSGNTLPAQILPNTKGAIGNSFIWPHHLYLPTVQKRL
jgi:hypothetical protein